MDETTWRRRTGPYLLSASIAFIIAYSWRVITDASGAAALTADIVILVTWCMFVIDYIAKLRLAKGHRWRWFRTHLGDIAFTLIPVLRVVLVLRVFTRIPGLHLTKAAALRTRILVFGVGSTAILIYVASLQVLDAERRAAGATIVSFGDAVWWACVTATTTGFGDFTPVTMTGRVVGVIVMFGGLALAGIITATLASWVLERGAHRADDSDPAATRGDVRALRDEVAALRSELTNRDAPEQ